MIIVIIFFSFLFCRVYRPSRTGFQSLGGLQNLGAGQKRPLRVGLQTRSPGVCSLTMPHQTNLLFFIVGSVDPGERVCSQAPRVCNFTMPHQIVQSTVKSLIVYSNLLYSIK